jgi:hypothetical protein
MAEFVTVSAGETVDDTLLAAGNTVRVEGVVIGDVLAFGRNVRESLRAGFSLVALESPLSTARRQQYGVPVCRRSICLCGLSETAT